MNIKNFLIRNIIVLLSMIALFPFNLSAIESASGSDVKNAQAIYLLAADRTTLTLEAQILIKKFRSPVWDIEINTTDGKKILDAQIEITDFKKNVGITFNGKGVNKITGQDISFHILSLKPSVFIEINGLDSNGKPISFDGPFQGIFSVHDHDENPYLILVSNSAHVTLEELMSTNWKQTTTKKLKELFKSVAENWKWHNK